ncbi:MAG: hypothetical protein ACR2QK_23500 [Acidimicrobiales bacterium]
MRRGFASLIIGLSLIVASASWAGFTLSRTVLDPGRSERLADQLLENPDVRRAMTARLADALEDQIPPEIPVRRQLLETGAEQALDDPRVEALIRDGFVRVHQNALEGNGEPVVIDAGSLGAAGRDALVLARPELDGVLPPTPVLELELPTAGFSWIGSVKNFVDRFTTIGALVALFGAVTAFAVARDRAPVLRRVAFWGYGAAGFWLAVGYGIPWVAGNLSPTSGAIATAAADVFFGAMIRPAIVMAVVATAILIAGILWPFFQRRRGAGALQPRRRPATTAMGGRVPTAGARPTVAGTPAGGGTVIGAATGVTAGAGARPVRSPVADSTDPMPIPTAPTFYTPIVDNRVIDGGRAGWGRDVGIDISFNQDPAPTTPTSTWREGEGYVEDDRPESGPAGRGGGGATARPDDPSATRRFRP